MKLESILNFYVSQRRNLSNDMSSVVHDSIIRILKGYPPQQAVVELTKKRDLNLRYIAEIKQAKYHDAGLAQSVEKVMHKRVSMYNQAIVRVKATDEYQQQEGD